MERELTITIRLGNEAVQEPSDAASLIREVADKLESGTENGKIYDGNGNTVGKFQVNRKTSK